MKKYYDGQPMGCTDSAPPEEYSNYELSRAVDILNTSNTLGRGIRQKVWDAFPKDLRMEINWAKWTYLEKV